jgi:hypothetical protein
MKKKHNVWRLWCYALGEKQGKTNKEADIIAIIRTVILTTYLITNVAIVSNAVRHWNNVNYSQKEVKND